MGIVSQMHHIAASRNGDWSSHRSRIIAGLLWDLCMFYAKTMSANLNKNGDLPMFDEKVWE